MSTAITFSEYGAPEVLQLSEVALPQPGPGQVRIRVRAASVNPLDMKIRSGLMAKVAPARFPMIPGLDAAGVVDAVGEGAGAAVGDEVLGATVGGSYSEYALIERPVAKPEALSWEVAASLVTVGQTAHRVLGQLGVQAGQTLLVHGAAGSVGFIAVQLAAARGITVIGTVSEKDIERVTALGATAVRYGDGWAERVTAAAPGGVDYVFDASGAGVLADSVALTGDAAKVITIADMSAQQHGVRFSAGTTDQGTDALPELVHLVAEGRLTVPIWRTYPLAETAQAHADLEAHRNHGKAVLLP
ncbi:NADP-dependent oxidoreductase [Kitasatospora aureofaciens]|uniref:NADPH:quinone reductase n=1 Tax=Kitasatospora aureofaciens TaxID=1894 RepID=A0A1E7N1U4_KITAU|nr:NADP-dependent oxidoreductase [Kitasatospora aureofaciens]QEV03486.1 NADP-dependent oxidoreductase [Streptomyces viridifaciens]ARF81982.1 NADPH:quinone reductase [Kitasatospora aureofaciens]OEV34652.1 NADPH:quinone reductase [Kitasatospora aureofaciens]UKZ03709.1 NADP-dependent oxidoreductase [Streptomyces viridifaciens]GGV01843.1 NADPH:quinone reductase [Kitasatospora aureofaciens]